MLERISHLKNPVVFSEKSIRLLIVAYLISRCVLFLVAFLAPNISAFIFDNPGWEKSFIEIFDFKKANILENVCITDCRSYIEIAKNGYENSPNKAFHFKYYYDNILISDSYMMYANWAFFPVLPLLISALHVLTGLDHLMVTFLISQSMALVGFFLFHAYVQHGWDRQTADKAIVYYAFWPIGVYMSSPMTEAIFVPLLLAILLAAQRRAWLFVVPLVALFSGLRVVGILIVFPLLLIAIRQYGWRNLLMLQPGTEKALLALTACALGLALYMIYLHQLTGDALAFSHIQGAWWRQVEWPWVRVLDAFNPLKFEVTDLHFALQLQVAIAIWAFIVSLRLLKQKNSFYASTDKSPEWLYFILCLLVGLASDNITSLVRFISVHVCLIIPFIQNVISQQEHQEVREASLSNKITIRGLAYSAFNITYFLSYIIWSLVYFSKSIFAV